MSENKTADQLRNEIAELKAALREEAPYAARGHAMDDPDISNCGDSECPECKYDIGKERGENFTISDESDCGSQQYRVTVKHPNKGVSEVVVGLGEDGRLEVAIDPSSTNNAIVYYEDMTILDVAPFVAAEEGRA